MVATERESENKRHYINGGNQSIFVSWQDWYSREEKTKDGWGETKINHFHPTTVPGDKGELVQEKPQRDLGSSRLGIPTLPRSIKKWGNWGSLWINCSGDFTGDPAGLRTWVLPLRTTHFTSTPFQACLIEEWTAVVKKGLNLRLASFHLKENNMHRVPWMGRMMAEMDWCVYVKLGHNFAL